MSWGEYWLHCEGARETLFTENESNAQRLWNQPNASPYVKDAFHAYLISGQRDTVNPARTGTKAAAHYVCDVPGGGSADDPLAPRAIPAGRCVRRLSSRRSIGA